MEKYISKFNVRYELKDNGDTTQNLYARSYQNSSLICETDFGEISQIVAGKKENDDLKQALNEIREIIIEHKKKDDHLYLNEWQTRDVLEIIDKVLGEEK